MVKDFYSEEIENSNAATSKDFYSTEIANEEIKEEKDMLATAVGKIEGISAPPSPLERATSRTINQAKNIGNSMFLGIPGMIFPEQVKPRGLSPQEEFEGMLMGASVPVGVVIGATGKYLIKPAAKQLGRFFAPGKRSWQQMASAINKATNQKYSGLLKNASDKATKNITDSVGAIKSNIGALTEELTLAADRASLSFQKHLPKFFKANSMAYGDKVDEIIELASKNGQGMTRQEVYSLNKRVLEEIVDEGLPSSASKDLIEQYVTKYAPKMVAKPSKFVRASSGVKPTTLVSNADDVIPISDLLADYKRINNTLSSSFKSGSYGFAPEDISVAIYKRSMGDSLSKIAPEWAALNKSYAPVIEAKKQAYKIFKPTKGDIATKTGEGFIKRKALGKLAEGEKRFLGVLEEGSDLAVGVGNLSDEAAKIGDQINSLKMSIEPTKAGIKTAAQLEKSKIVAEQTKRLAQLTERKKKLELLSAQRTKAETIQKALWAVGTAATAIGGGSAFIAGKEVMRGTRDN